MQTVETTEASDQPVPCGAPGASLPETFELITSIAKRLANFESRTLRESGLTPTQFFVLTQLAEHEVSLAGLASAAGCARATMTGIADTLERNGLAQRIPNPADRRGILVRLTDTGRSRLASPGLAEAFGSCCCDILTAEEASELARLLTKLSGALPF